MHLGLRAIHFRASRIHIALVAIEDRQFDAEFCESLQPKRLPSQIVGLKVLLNTCSDSKVGHRLTTCFQGRCCCARRVFPHHLHCRASNTYGSAGAQATYCFIPAWVPKTLERVLRSVVGVAEVLTGDIPFPPFDWHCPFVSLPRVFETSLATIPNAVPYIVRRCGVGSALEGTTAYRWHAGRAGVGRSGTPTSPWVRCGRCQTQHQTRDIRTAGGGGGRALHQFADRPGGGSGEDAAIRA